MFMLTLFPNVYVNSLFKCLPLFFQFRTWQARIWTVLHVRVGDVRHVRERRVLRSTDWTRKGDAKQQPPEMKRINIFITLQS